MTKDVAKAMIRHCDENGDRMFDQLLAWFDKSTDITRIDPKKSVDPDVLKAHYVKANETAKLIRFGTLARLNMRIEEYLMRDPKIRTDMVKRLGPSDN